MTGRVYLRADLTSGPAEWDFDVLSPEEGPFIPVYALGNAEPEYFGFIFFSRTPSAVVFYVFATIDTLLPHLKIVIPTDPGGSFN